MHDFKYCIWLMPEKNHPFNNITNGFRNHLTVNYYLQDYSIFDRYNEINDNFKPIKVKLLGTLHQTYTDNFYSLIYKITPIDKKPEWWPKNAHLSFAYQYDKPFTPIEIRDLENKIKIRQLTLSELKINKCSGDFKYWKKF